MLRKMALVFLVVALLVTMAQACNSSGTSEGAPVYGNKIGNLAYDFSLSGVDGTIVNLSALLGHTVMLTFWSTT